MAAPGNTASGAAAAPTVAGNQAAAPASAASGMKATSDNSAGVATGEVDPADLLKQARAAYDAGKFDQAIAALDQFRRIYPAAGDEAWWLYGQSFEANSPSRDIRSAMDAYTRLAREFPQSKYYDDAQKRIAYLNKFYFNIR
jgi:outer membrane protein assembly factor BamD (BamD/ComL family)